MGVDRLFNNRYQLLEHIRSGDLIETFRARDLSLDRLVTIGTLPHPFKVDRTSQQRLYREAGAAAHLSHPNILTIYDFGFDQDELFLVMEYIPGKDLKALLGERKRFSVEDAIPLMAQACAGVGYAHRLGRIHGNIKPHRLIVTPDGHLKVTGFGLTNLLFPLVPDANLASPQYFSPEQEARQRPTPASDVYSLGVVLYEMLTGALPFPARTSAELVHMHLAAAPIPPSEYVPVLPSALEQIVLKALSREPAARYGNADDLGRALLRFESDRAPVPGKTTANRKLRVFLCHSKGDKTQVRSLYHRLAADGFDAWLDEEKLIAGQDWDLEIRKAVRTVDVVVVCLSNDSVNKAGYVQKEIRFALDVADEQPEGAIYIIPARLDDCQVPSRLTKWQWIDLFEEKGYEQLRNSLMYRLNTLSSK